MKDRTIILLTHEYPPKRGGAGTYCEELVHACASLGFRIEAWVPEYGREEENGRVIPLAIKGTQGLTCSIKSMLETAKRLRRREDKVLLHFAEPGALRAFLRFGRLLGELPALTATIHGTELLRFCSNPLEKFLFRRQLRKIGRIHVLSDFNRRALLEIFPELEEKILLLPGAPARELAGRAKRPENHGKKRLSILCVGRLHPRKGQDRLLLALGSLPSSALQRIECLFVGPVVDRKFMEEVRRKADQVPCPVSFLGDLKDADLRAVYEGADLFVLPSMPRAKSVEGFGFVYLEAGSHGLPVLANRTGGVEDAVLDGKTGLLADPEDWRDLSKHLLALIENEDLREKLGEAGARWAQKHSWEKVARQLYSNA